MRIRLGAAVVLGGCLLLAPAFVWAGTLGGEPPDFPNFFPGPVPTLTAVAGANTVDGTLGPTGTGGDGQDAFNVVIPAGLQLTSTDFTGPTGGFFPYNLLGCGLNGTDDLTQVFTPPQSNCTLTYILSTDFAPAAVPWTVTVNAQDDPNATTTTTVAPTTTTTAPPATTTTAAPTTTTTAPPATTTTAAPTTTTTVPAATTTTVASTTTTTSPVVTPTAKDECKKGGWAGFGFRNQGQCIKFVNQSTPPTASLQARLVRAVRPDTSSANTLLALVLGFGLVAVGLVLPVRRR